MNNNVVIGFLMYYRLASVAVMLWLMVVKNVQFASVDTYKQRQNDDNEGCSVLKRSVQCYCYGRVRFMWLSSMLQISIVNQVFFYRTP